MAKKPARKPAASAPKAGAADKKKPAAPPWLKGGETPPAKPAAPPSKPKAKKPLEISPIARQVLMNARKRSPLDAARAGTMSKGEVEAIRQFAVALAENELGLGTDEDLVLICNRATEPSPIPITELLYDTCRWCEADIYYDRMMPRPPGLMRVCMPCGIMLLDADKKGRN